MNISNAYELSLPYIKPMNLDGVPSGSDSEDMFSSVFQSALNSLNKTNGYLSQAENEEIRLALGETDNAHDLSIALQKASTALQYTVAIRDKFLEAYKEIINMQF